MTQSGAHGMIPKKRRDRLTSEIFDRILQLIGRREVVISDLWLR